MPVDSMKLEDLARLPISLSTTPIKSIQVALDFKQAMHQVQEQNLDGFYANIEQVNKDLLRMADEQESAEGEPMKWPEMTPDQRDRLVHERVMGHSPDEQCTGLFWSTTDTQTGECGCQCDGCGAYYPADDTLVYEHQQPNAPAYTTDMNAAWQITESEQFRSVDLKRHESSPWVNAWNKYTCAITRGYEVFHYVGSTPQEAICFAALRACGVEIEVAQ